MDRHTYYAALRRAARPNHALWTHETSLVALHLYATEEHCWPGFEACTAAEGLPSQATVARLWGTLRRWREACTVRHGTQVPPAQPAPDAHPGLVRCLRCDQLWRSPDKRQYRICPRCTEQPEWEEGAWLPGAPVIRNGTYDLEPAEALVNGWHEDSSRER